MNIIDVGLKFKSLSYGNKPNKLVLHHAEASKCSVQDIHYWHLNNGWSGIGYHYFIRKDGSIYKGRPDGAIGAHCQGSNLPIYGHKELLATECPGANFPLADFKALKENEETATGYIVTTYLPNGYRGDGSFVGVDLEYVLSYFKDIRCYVKGDSKGIWIETQVLPIEKCKELQKTLGSWFYAIR